MRVDVGGGACGLAFQNSGRVVIHYTEIDPRYADYREYARIHCIRNVLSTPFFVTEGAPLGVLSIYRNEHQDFSERVLRLSDVCAA